jgi:hypothetical protein
MNTSIWYEVHKWVVVFIQVSENGDEVTHFSSGPKDCLKTSMWNYHYTLGNITDDCRSQVETIKRVTLKPYSAETLPFIEAPYIFIQPVSPRLSCPHASPVPSPLLSPRFSCSLSSLVETTDGLIRSQIAYVWTSSLRRQVLSPPMNNNMSGIHEIAECVEVRCA